MPFCKLKPKLSSEILRLSTIGVRQKAYMNIQEDILIQKYMYPIIETQIKSSKIYFLSTWS